MTVDQNSFESFHRLDPERANDVINKLREVTGIEDVKVLAHALEITRTKSGKWNLTGAIDVLLGCEQAENWEEDLKEKGTLSKDSNKENQDSTGMAPTPAIVINPQGVESQCRPRDVAADPSAVGSDAASPVEEGPKLVDLTGEKEEKSADPSEADLQKAIALSLRESGNGGGGAGLAGQVSQEDRDVSRALEASLAETGGAKRKRGETWIDPLDPHERERDGKWPVGLKNVGQTCWFSAVIQSLFHLPYFRSIVVNFHPRSATERDSEKVKRTLEFMQELRKLFALLVASNRKYVDPSSAVDILRGSLGSQHSDNQQDISEFTHKLLEWVEEAFNLAERNEGEKGDGVGDNLAEMVDVEDVGRSEDVVTSEKKGSSLRRESSEKSVLRNKSNPMAMLFYGQFRVEGTNEGHTFSNTETFGQWPLQVNNYSDIHESLEGSTAHEFFDSPQVIVADPSDKIGQQSGQEHWFIQLPPILMFELSRFQYNQQRGQAEKIHNKLDIPQILYMDRYMEVNKNITRSKRDEIRRLKEKRTRLQRRLDRYLEYGSGESKCSLQLLLDYTLEFARTGNSEMKDVPAPPRICSRVDSDVEMNSPAGSLAGVEGPRESPSRTAPLDDAAEKMDESVAENETPMEVETRSEGDDPCEGGVADRDEVPSPRHVSEMELKVLRQCITRWRGEVESDVKALRDSISQVEHKIRNMYEEPSLKHLKYKLHAVLVHEGQVDSGHYWAYVVHHGKNAWLKFNDNSVTEASWDELVKESAGGHCNASAYSVMYIDDGRSDLLVEGAIDGSENGSRLRADEEGSSEEVLDLCHLPLPLKNYVEDDNLDFEKEVSRWDEEQRARQKVAAETSDDAGESVADVSNADGDVEILGEKHQIYNSYIKWHAQLVLKNSLLLVEQNKGKLETEGPVKVTLQILNADYNNSKKKYNMLVSKDYRESRLESFLIYLIANQVQVEPWIHLALCEQYTQPQLEIDQKAKRIVQEVRNQYMQIKSAPQFKDLLELYRRWHECYHHFRRSHVYLLKAISLFFNNKFEDGLDILIVCYRISMLIDELPTSGKEKVMKMDTLLRLLRTCLSNANQRIIKRFVADDGVEDVFHDVQNLVVPSVQILCLSVDLSNSSCVEAKCLEEIRSRWCNLLSHDGLNEKQSSVLQSILSLILDPPPIINKIKSIPPNLHEDDSCLSVKYTELTSKLYEQYGSSIHQHSSALNTSKQIII